MIPELGPFTDDVRIHCVDIIIFDDNIREGAEDFSVCINSTVDIVQIGDGTTTVFIGDSKLHDCSLSLCISLPHPSSCPP